MRKGKNGFRRAAAVVCALALCAGTMPTAAFAEETDVTTQDPAAATSAVTEETTENTEDTDPVDSTASTETTDVTDSTDTADSTDETESAEQTDDTDAADSTESTEDEVNAGETQEEAPAAESDSAATEEKPAANGIAMLSLDNEGTPESKAGETVEIDSSEDLVDAILHQADGQTWVFTQAGTYDVYNAANYKEDNTNLPATNKGYGGYVPADGVTLGDAPADSEYIFPIYVNNLTIKKEASVTGEVVLTSTARPDSNFGGMWNYQNFITVAGNNVTIENVSIKANINDANEGTCNKVIEVLANNFTVDGVTFKNVNEESENKFAGTLYVGKTGVTTTVKNCVFDYGRISLSGADATNNVVVENVKLDFAGAYNEGYYAFYNPNGTPVKANNLTVTATPNCLDTEPNSMGEMLGMLPDYTTLQLKPGNYNLVPGKETVNGETGWYMPITKPVTVQGIDENGNVITDASQTKANIYSTHYTANGALATQDLISVFADDVTIEGVTIMNKDEANKAIEVCGPAKNFTLQNCTICPTSTDLQPGADQTYGGLVYFNGMNSADDAITATIKNNTFKHASLYFGSTYGGEYTVTGNTFDGNQMSGGKYAVSFGYINNWNGGSGIGDAKISVSENTFKDIAYIWFPGITDTTSAVASFTNNTWYDKDGNLEDANAVAQKLNGVMEMDGVLYASSEDALKVALAAAEAGDTIKLTKDITLSDTLILDKDITIDGDGHTITGNFTGNNVVGFQVNDGTATFLDMNLKDFDTQTAPYGSVIKIDEGHDGAKVVADGLNISNFAREAFSFKAGSFEVRNTTIDCKPSEGRTNHLTKGFQIGLGTSHVTGLLENVNIKNSSSDYEDWSTSAIEIYNDADVTIKGGSIQDCKQGIWVDNYWAGSDSFPNLTGDTSVTIDGTTIDAQDYAVITYGREGAATKASVTINSGNFKGEISMSEASGNEKITVLGGTFDSDPSAFIPDGYEYEVGSDGTFTVVKEQPEATQNPAQDNSNNQTTTSQNNSTTQSGSGIVYYTCPACGYHDWTAGADGYKCNHCGYVESVKQLSGYGNVKGVYEPKTSAAAAQSASATSSSAIPQTSDAMPVGLLGGVTVVAAAAFAALFVLRKRKHND